MVGIDRGGDDDVTGRYETHSLAAPAPTPPKNRGGRDRVWIARRVQLLEDLRGQLARRRNDEARVTPARASRAVIRIGRRKQQSYRARMEQARTSRPPMAGGMASDESASVEQSRAL